jgi:glycolate oxidase iron-sulfur subunit
MKTTLSELVRQTTWGKEAESILRACVHCGFCTAVCPTYQVLGNELDSPRGRIYLIKALLEEQDVGRETQRHLDQCLTCRACELACPSGVQYGHLLNIGRELMEEQVERPLLEELKRWSLRTFLSNPLRFSTLLKLGRLVRPILPNHFRTKIPPRVKANGWPSPHHSRHMIVLEGCVQPSLVPNINVAAAKVLDRLGISLLASTSGCCGALSYHLAAHEEGLNQMRHIIDEWWPFLETGTEAVVVTASGCGAFIKEYGYLLRDDPDYAEKANRVSELTLDISEILAREDTSVLFPTTPPPKSAQRVALHIPCTLQYGQKLVGLIEPILTCCGFELTTVSDGHLCCGSAGTYSILHKQISQDLLERKLKALTAGKPQLIATANIGCHTHLQSQTKIPVKHWIELVAERLDKTPSYSSYS